MSAATPSGSTSGPNNPVSFANDIAPMFFKFRAQMRWRFDLANYDDVKANADAILANIQGPNPNMQPEPYPPYSTDQVETFIDWMNQGYPE